MKKVVEINGTDCLPYSFGGSRFNWQQLALLAFDLGEYVDAFVPMFVSEIANKVRGQKTIYSFSAVYGYRVEQSKTSDTYNIYKKYCICVGNEEPSEKRVCEDVVVYGIDGRELNCIIDELIRDVSFYVMREIIGSKVHLFGEENAPEPVRYGEYSIVQCINGEIVRKGDRNIIMKDSSRNKYYIDLYEFIKDDFSNTLKFLLDNNLNDYSNGISFDKLNWGYLNEYYN